MAGPLLGPGRAAGPAVLQLVIDGEDRDQLAAETLAAVEVAQAREAQRRGGDELARHLLRARAHDTVQAQMQVPAVPGQHRGFQRREMLLRAVAEQSGDGLLHRVVVIVAHLGLAVLEDALAGLARREEQVGIGMARGFKPGLDLVAAMAAGRAALGLQRGLRPQLGQRRQALLVGQPGCVGNGGAALGRQLRAVLALQADDAQRLLGGGAEPAGGEDVGAALRQVFRWLDGTDPDTRATRQQRGGTQGEQGG
ncbi:hypothetical protein ACFQOZ_08975 [Comamonas endophytica]|uniref:hypothetical protein n=1 Tax=Comamonas endophytica TaxID=2949090 RepID=UPI0036106357